MVLAGCQGPAAVRGGSRCDRRCGWPDRPRPQPQQQQSCFRLEAGRELALLKVWVRSGGWRRGHGAHGSGRKAWAGWHGLTWPWWSAGLDQGNAWPSRRSRGRWADGSAKQRSLWWRAGCCFGWIGELEGARPWGALSLVLQQGGEATPFCHRELQGLDLPQQPAGAAPAEEPLGPHRIAFGCRCLFKSCPLYKSDAAAELIGVKMGGPAYIKKEKTSKIWRHKRV